MSGAKLYKVKDEMAKRKGKGGLANALYRFSSAADHLGQSYAALKEQVGELSRDLDRKNRELETNLIEREIANDYLSNILKSLNVGVIVMDRQLKITTFNRAAETMTGLSAEAVVNRHLPQLEGFEVGRRVLEAMDEHALQGCQGVEFSTFGNDPCHFSFSISPLRNKQDEAIGMVVILEDITRVKKLEEQVRRTDRLTAMGELAAKMAHEIRNPLGSIELCATSLRMELRAKNYDVALIDHILSGVKSLNNAVSNMLLFTRSPEPSLSEVDLIDVMDESLRLAHYLLKKNNVKPSTDYACSSMVIQSDRELLKQIFLNLILNAAQAMPQGGSLEVSAFTFSRGPRYPTGAHSLNGVYKKGWQEWVGVRIKDTGHGIAKEIRERIFDPFFTTREGGTGLGLAIVHNIVERLRGAVEVENSPGEGTAFSITLPRYPLQGVNSFQVVT